MENRYEKENSFDRLVQVKIWGQLAVMPVIQIYRICPTFQNTLACVVAQKSCYCLVDLHWLPDWPALAPWFTCVGSLSLPGLPALAPWLICTCSLVHMHWFSGSSALAPWLTCTKCLVDLYGLPGWPILASYLPDNWLQNCFYSTHHHHHMHLTYHASTQLAWYVSHLR